ncbi:MAG: LLM class flavin-dependent oxidoreductase [Chloroflexi bacterium]|nr:LLM class flavin-dependent oxidoreductase [Chloroflexota bacterium]
MASRALGLWGESTAELVDVARRAETAGFASVWTDELERTPFVPLAAVAAGTAKVQLGTGAALAFVRSPLVTALTALDLDELSRGRLILGLGSGVQRLNEDWHGVPFGKPVPHMREAVAAIRAIMAGAHMGEPIVFQGDYYRIRIRGYQRPFPPVREHLPIFLGGIGPQMVALAGEVADGWLGHELNTPRYLREVIMPRLKVGFDRSGRQRRDLSVCPTLVCAIAGHPRDARRIAAGTVAFYATVRTYAPLFIAHGFGEPLERIQHLFRSGQYPAMVQAVPDEMVDAFVAAGTPDQVRARLADYEDLADVVKVAAPHYFLEPEVIRAQQLSLIEHLSP